MTLFPSLPSALAITGCSLLLATTAVAQSTVYTSDYANASYSGMTANGGTIIVPMVLHSGSALPGLGSSFNVTFTISSVTPYFGGTYPWSLPPPDMAVDYYG